MLQIRHLTTKRLTIRQLRSTDIADYQIIINDPVNHQMAGQTLPRNPVQTQLMLQQAIRDHTLALTLPSNQVIGIIELRARFTGQPPVPDAKTIELGYLMQPSFRRQGYMTEALSAVIQACHQQKLREIWAAVFLNNFPSIKLLKKLGFKYQYTVDLALTGLGYVQKEAYYAVTL